MFQQRHQENISRIVRKFIDAIKPSPYNLTAPGSPAFDQLIPVVATPGLPPAVHPAKPLSNAVSHLTSGKPPISGPSLQSLSQVVSHASLTELPLSRAASCSRGSLALQISNYSDSGEPSDISSQYQQEVSSSKSSFLGLDLDICDHRLQGNLPRCQEGLSAPPPSNENVASSSNRKGVSARNGAQKTKKERREVREARKRQKLQRVACAGALIKAFSENKPLDQFTSEIDCQEDIVAVDLYLNEYRELLREIEENSDLARCFHSGLKYEYTSTKKAKQFAIRMPRPVHGNVAGAINSALTEWSVLVRNGTAKCGTGECGGQNKKCLHKNTRSIAGKIQDVSDKNITYMATAESDTNIPDGSFELKGIKDFRHASLIVEVGWAQTSSELSQKCQGYIQKSRGRIRTVVGIDLYDLYECYKAVIGRVGKVTPGEAKATGMKRIHEMAAETLKREATAKISVWYSLWDKTTDTAKAQIAFSNHRFRDKYGKPIGNVALCLSLQAFISERIEDRFPLSHNPRCAISVEFLCSRLDDGLEEMLTDILASAGDEEPVASQINLNPDLVSRVIEDETESSGPPSFLPGPPTPQVNPTEHNIGGPIKILQKLRRSSRIARLKA